MPQRRRVRRSRSASSSGGWGLAPDASAQRVARCITGTVTQAVDVIKREGLHSHSYRSAVAMELYGMVAAQHAAGAAAAQPRAPGVWFWGTACGSNSRGEGVS